MYELVRVDGQLRMIERNLSPRLPFPHRLPASDFNGMSPPLWTPCNRLEKQFWKSFARTGIAEEPSVPKAILESWKRCRNASVEFEGKCEFLISPKEIDERRGLLYEVSEPIMETLFQCLRGSRNVIVLVDRDGYILHSLGDVESLRQAEKLNFGPGANWSEYSVGTNAIGTALAIGDPIQVTGCEHYHEDHQTWTCAATPIRNPEDEIFGCLDISGPREEAQFLTLGMTVAAVRAIEERLRLEQSHRYHVNMNTHFAAVFSSVREGIITIDNRGTITGVNASAARLLETSPERVTGSHIHSVMRMDNKLQSFFQAGREYSEEELSLKSRKGEIRCLGSANVIYGENGFKLGTVFTLTEIKKPFAHVNATSKGNLRFKFMDIVGQSRTMLETLEKAKKVAGSSSTVLVLGESGTGKELFAQSIHNASDRRNGPFISVNCGALPGELIQSELFGYAEGAFTGARKGGRPGKIELANGGSIFFDEIGDMPLQMQVNLVRVLEEKAVVRIGDNKVVSVDVRIIAATNKSLYEEVRKGRFREDLFYRLNVVTIILPPLRERKGDVTLLANHFIERLKKNVGKNLEKVEPEVFAALEAYHWPGNVRELANVLEYAINLLDGAELKFAHLPAYLKKKQVVQENPERSDIIPLMLLEKMAIENTLLHFGGNISKVAAALKIGRNTLYDKLRKHGIRA